MVTFPLPRKDFSDLVSSSTSLSGDVKDEANMDAAAGDPVEVSSSSFFIFIKFFALVNSSEHSIAENYNIIMNYDLQITLLDNNIYKYIKSNVTHVSLLDNKSTLQQWFVYMYSTPDKLKRGPTSMDE